jgi:hypothetical protein
MNLSIFPIQIYRITRHIAGKAYVRMFNKKPRLYFYPHSISWFKKNFSFASAVEIYCWRSTNKYFLNAFIHRLLWGKKLLNRLKLVEEKHTRFMGSLGEYPLIVIKK